MRWKTCTLSTSREKTRIQSPFFVNCSITPIITAFVCSFLSDLCALNWISRRILASCAKCHLYHTKETCVSFPQEVHTKYSPSSLQFWNQTCKLATMLGRTWSSFYVLSCKWIKGFFFFLVAFLCSSMSKIGAELANPKRNCIFFCYFREANVALWCVWIYLYSIWAPLGVFDWRHFIGYRSREVWSQLAGFVELGRCGWWWLVSWIVNRQFRIE